MAELDDAIFATMKYRLIFQKPFYRYPGTVYAPKLDVYECESYGIADSCVHMTEVMPLSGPGLPATLAVVVMALQHYEFCSVEAIVVGHAYPRGKRKEIG